MPQGRTLRPPAQGARRDRPTDPGADQRRRAAAAGMLKEHSAGCTTSCSGCTTRPSGASDAQDVADDASRSRRSSAEASHAGIVDAAQLAGRVHRQLRHPDVDGGDPEPRRGERPDRRAAGHVVARHEHLPRHTRRGARMLEQRGRVGRGRVALVGVQLDRRAGVDERAVRRVVTLGVVGVHRVGVVGRNARRGRRGRGGDRRAVPPRRGRAARGRARGAVRWRRSCSPTRPPRGRSGRSSTPRRRAGDAASDVVAAQHDTWLSSRPLASSDTSPPEHGGALHVVEAQLPPRRPIDRGGVGEPLGELARCRRRAAPDRMDVLLRVELQAAVVHARDRGGSRVAAPAPPVGARRPDATSRRPITTRPAIAEVAVEPRVEENAAVDLDAELTPARAARCRDTA